MEYAKIKSGAMRAKMANREHAAFVELRRADACPEGFLPVEKVLPKPVPGEGEELCYEYVNRGDRMTKEYFVAPKGTSFKPVRYSKLKIYGAISNLGAWERVKAWLEGKEVDGINGWMAFQLAQEVSSDHPMFRPLAEEARQMLGLTDDEFAALLAACVLDE